MGPKRNRSNWQNRSKTYETGIIASYDFQCNSKPSNGCYFIAVQKCTNRETLNEQDLHETMEPNVTTFITIFHVANQ